jgi:hypothetical protein
LPLALARTMFVTNIQKCSKWWTNFFESVVLNFQKWKQKKNCGWLAQCLSYVQHATVKDRHRAKSVPLKKLYPKCNEPKIWRIFLRNFAYSDLQKIAECLLIASSKFIYIKCVRFYCMKQYLKRLYINQPPILLYMSNPPNQLMFFNHNTFSRV